MIVRGEALFFSKETSHHTILPFSKVAHEVVETTPTLISFSLTRHSKGYCSCWFVSERSMFEQL